MTTTLQEINTSLTWYYANKEKVLARQAEYRKTNKKHVLEIAKKSREKHKEKYKAKDKERRQAIKKQKPSPTLEERAIRKQEQYQKRLEYKRQYYYKHKEELCLKEKIRRQQNKTAIELKEKQYREKNKQKANERAKFYYYTNKKECIKKNIEYKAQRKKQDPLFAAKEKLRKAVQSSFARIKKSKPTNTLALLGCSWEEAKSHIESLWTEGMTWKNHGTGSGKWQIDHIRPVSSFKEHELYLMNHISNLQPLWMEDNLQKKDKYEACKSK